MFKLPKCPYCGAKYYYKDVLNVKKEKNPQCYHCKKLFEIKKASGCLLLFSLVVTLSIVTNIAILHTQNKASIITLIIVSVLYISIGIVLIPFFIKFKKK